MALAQVARDGEPLSELNTTPLIDVLLVMLIMLILTLPPVTNTLEYSLPSPQPGPKPDPVENTITITAADTILWNGQFVSEGELETALARAVALRPEPQLLLSPDGRASYAESARVLQLIKRSGATNVGFAGSERFGTFGR